MLTSVLRPRPSKMAIRLRAVAPLALLGIAAACDGFLDPGESDLVLTGQARHSAFVGSEVPFWVEVQGKDSKGVEGVTVHFAIVSGVGGLRATRAVSDSYGVVKTAVKLGPEPGELTIVEARLKDGRQSLRITFTTVSPHRVQLDADSLVLTPGCSRIVTARFPNESRPSIEWAITDSSVAELKLVSPVGTPAYTSRVVVPRRAGTALITASYNETSGTVPLRVIPGEERVPSRVRFNVDTTTIASGTSFGFGISVALEDQGGCPLSGFDLALSSLRPQVATISADPSPQGNGKLFPTIHGHAAGTAPLVASALTLADTFMVRVLDVKAVPADTTVRVGEKVKYRLFTADASGIWEEVRHVGVIDPSGIVSGPRLSGDSTTAVAPGTAQLHVHDSRRENHIYTKATIHVVP